MKTVISTDVDAAVELLLKGEVVALPTETVYGLAADALSSEAVAKIFEAKQRPRFDPLIVHLPDIQWLERVTDVSTFNQDLLLKLVERFWPGPFTIVLPKTHLIPDIVTAGLDTVAVRISAHPSFISVIHRLDRPLAAPSANQFGRVSPTAASHVHDELAGRIPLILDGGATTHGIESTIVAMNDGAIEVLRRGPVTDDELRAFAPADQLRFSSGETIQAPGQLPSHYAPRKPVQLIGRAEQYTGDAKTAGLLAWHEVQTADQFAAVRELSRKQDLGEAAANLFRFLRELDATKAVRLILAEEVPDRGLGAAIMDRLGRAAYKNRSR